MNYGEKIYRLRKSKGMTQEELGKVLNVTYQAVSKWERDESLPDLDTISQIAGYFDVPLQYFVDGEEIRTSNPSSPTNVCNNYIGTCTECGRMLKDGEEYTTKPKILCKDCADRLERETLQTKIAQEKKLQYEREREIRNQRGGGIDLKLIISVVLAVACYVFFAVQCFSAVNFDDAGFYGLLFVVVPLAVFGCCHGIFDLISELRSTDDGPEGYTLIISLIIGAIFTIINVVIFAVLYSASHEGYYIILLASGAILSFTFVSQFLWGNVITEIFSAGGFTFKLPGFIFSLSFESILFMIIAKLFLGIVAVVVFIITTIFMAVVAVAGSVFTFIPALFIKIAKDKKV